MYIVCLTEKEIVIMHKRVCCWVVYFVVSQLHTRDLGRVVEFVASWHAMPWHENFCTSASFFVLMMYAFFVALWSTRKTDKSAKRFSLVSGEFESPPLKKIKVLGI